MARRYRSNAGAIVASVVGTLVAAALVFCVWFWWEPISGFFKDIGLLFQIAGEKVEQEKEKQESGFVFDDESSFHEGIFLTSVRIEEDDYAAYDVVEQAESAYTIEATIEPAGYNFALDWAVEFVNASSTWANGKTVTDYVTVSPYGDNGAVVSCLQPFGEKINVKVVVAENTALRATCTCNYQERLTGISNPYVKGYSESTSYEQNKLVDGVFFDIRSDLEYTGVSGYYNLTAGTISFVNNVTWSAEIKFNEEFYNNCKAASLLNGYLKTASVYSEISYFQLTKNIVNWTGDSTLDERQAAALNQVVYAMRGQEIGTIKIKASHADGSIEQEFPVYISEDFVSATAVNLSDSNLTF